MQPGRLREILPGGPKQSRIRGGETGAITPAPRCNGAPEMKFICFK